MNERPAGVNRNFSFFSAPRDPPRSSHEQPVLASGKFKKSRLPRSSSGSANPSGEPGNTAVYPVFKERGISPLSPSGHEQQPDASPRMRPRPACLINPSGNRGVCRPLGCQPLWSCPAPRSDAVYMGGGARVSSAKSKIFSAFFLLFTAAPSGSRIRWRVNNLVTMFPHSAHGRAHPPRRCIFMRVQACKRGRQRPLCPVCGQPGIRLAHIRGIRPYFAIFSAHNISRAQAMASRAGIRRVSCWGPA